MRRRLRGGGDESKLFSSTGGRTPGRGFYAQFLGS